MNRLKLSMVAMVLVLATTAACLGGIKPVTDLEAALARGKAEGKMVFILYGREACGNCQALKGMIKAGQVRLRESEVVYADVDCDDPKTKQKFYGTFKVEGRMLPFVVITDPSGRQLAGWSGSGTAEDFTKLVRDARKQWAPKPAGSAGTAAGTKTGIAAQDGRDMRAWTFKNGTSTEAALYSQTGSFVVLKKPDGTKVSVSATSLSAADAAYLGEVREESAATSPAAPVPQR
jgi:hypothetical protein